MEERRAAPPWLAPTVLTLVGSVLVYLVSIVLHIYEQQQAARVYIMQLERHQHRISDHEQRLRVLERESAREGKS